MEPRCRPSSLSDHIPDPGFFYLRLLGAPPTRELLLLRSGRPYTVGRHRRRCDVVLRGCRCISRRHCEILLDASDRRLRLLDGFSEQRFRPTCGGSRLSANGVLVNGRRLPRGAIADLNVGDEVLLGSHYGSNQGRRLRLGFIIEGIVFCDARVNPNPYPLDGEPGSSGIFISRVELLLCQLRQVLQSPDPVSSLRALSLNSIGSSYRLPPAASPVDRDPQKSCPIDAGSIRGVEDDHFGAADEIELDNCEDHPGDDQGMGAYHPDGKTIVLNRLKVIGPGGSEQCSGVTLPQLLHPIDGLLRVFIATFTCDVSWFLSYCKIPSHLPVTIACHNNGRCWSMSHESRASAPCPSHPNLLLIYPRFPEVIAFGKDRKKQGIACHHPKLIVLQRKEDIRVVVTSANLVPKQWHHITNTIWCQDFPCRTTPDYSALFGVAQDMEADFAAQLARFISSLVADIPGQAHWIHELAKYDFRGAFGHLVASIPGVHAENPCYLESDYCLSVKHTLNMKSVPCEFLGSVRTSVVGLRHRFHPSADPNGAQVKIMAELLGRCRENSNGTIEVLLKRNMNIPADINAVSVHIADFDKFPSGEFVHLGFLPRDIAKWVSHLSDGGFINFSAFIYPKEALDAALVGINTKIQLLLYVSKGPEFSQISRLTQPEHLSCLCLLLSSLNWSLGLWRLQEKTWQRLKSSGILHDAVPHPCARIGHPMHVKVARRRFQSKITGRSFGWLYCGSHNFSPAAWGRAIFPSSKPNAPEATPNQSAPGSNLHILNYEIGIVLVIPSSGVESDHLDDIVLPFAVPPPKYRHDDHPATAQAMRAALAEMAAASWCPPLEEMNEEIMEEEEGPTGISEFFAGEEEEEKIYAEMLWSQVDDSESS